MREKEHSHADNVEKPTQVIALDQSQLQAQNIRNYRERGLHLNDEHRYLEYKRVDFFKARRNPGFSERIGPSLHHRDMGPFK